jgi:cob(I)alamin adenosyltransferase
MFAQIVKFQFSLFTISKELATKIGSAYVKRSTKKEIKTEIKTMKKSLKLNYLILHFNKPNYNVIRKNI